MFLKICLVYLLATYLIYTVYFIISIFFLFFTFCQCLSPSNISILYRLWYKRFVYCFPVMTLPTVIYKNVFSLYRVTDETT